MKLKLCTALLTAASVFTPLSLVAEKAQNPADAKRAAVEVYGKLPLSFEPTESSARFLAHSGAYAVSVGVRESQVAVTNAKSGKTQTLRFAFDHANLAAPLDALEPQPGVTNYYLGQDASKWRLGVKNYKKVRAQAVYPGVDVVYYGDHRRLEFDFVVAPKADPRAIALSFSGMDRLYKDASGDLVAEVNGQPIHFVKPYAYQKVAGASKPVAVDYELAAAGSVHLRIGAYDNNTELIIDPVVTYANYLGSSATDVGNGIAVDGSGAAYVTGQTCFSDFATQSLSTNGVFSPSCDAYVTKFSPDGTKFEYTTIIGGAKPLTSAAIGNGIALDSSNPPNVYIVGTTNFMDLPNPDITTVYTNTLNTWQGGDSDAFIAILGPGGAVVRLSYLGGLDADAGFGIAVDTTDKVNVNNVTVVGQTCGLRKDTFPRYNGFETKVEFCAAFITKLDNGLHIGIAPGIGASALSPLDKGGVAGAPAYYFSEFYAGMSVPPAPTTDWWNNIPYPKGAIVLDNNGPPNVQIAQNSGTSNNNAIPPLWNPVPPAWNPKVKGLTMDGDITWENVGPQAPFPYRTSEAYGVALDPLGDVFVAGGTNTEDLGSSVVPYGPYSYHHGSGAWVLKVNGGQKTGQPGSFAYGTALETKQADVSATLNVARAIAVDTRGYAYVTGTADDTIFTTAGSYQPNSKGTDAFLVKMDIGGGAISYATYLGGMGDDQGLGVAVDTSGTAYVTGSTTSADFPTINPLTDPNGTPLQTVSGGQDAFVTKFTANGSALIFSAYLGGSSSDQGNAIATDTNNAGNMYVAGTTSSPDFEQALNPSAYTAPQATYGGGGSDAFVAMVAGASLPAVAVSPGSLYFTDQDLNISSAAKAIRYTNTNAVSAVNIQTISFSNSDFKQAIQNGIPGDCAQGKVLAAKSCDIWVVFTPTAKGTVHGTLTIMDDASALHVINLTGQTAVPNEVPSVTSLTFGTPQGVSTTSNPQPVTLQNTGTGTLYITSITITDPAGNDFAQTSPAPNACGTQVPTGASCTILVTFTPGGVGTRSGSLTITDNAPGSPHVTSLTGTGVLVASTVTPNLTFAQQATNVPSAPQTVIVKNTDPTQALSVSAVSISGDYAVVANTCGPPFLSTAVPPSCTIQVVFVPMLSGPLTGALTISGNGSTMPATVTLAGTAGATTTLTPAVNFSGTNIGTSSPALSAILSNSSGFPFNVQSIKIGGAAPGDFFQTNDCGTSVAALGNCTIWVTFTPKATGRRDANIVVTTDAANSAQSVGIVGVGTAPAVTLELAPGVPATNVTFPSQPLNAASTAIPITLTNSGTGPLNIPALGITFTGTAAGDFTETDTCGTQVASKASCTINVVFTPTALYGRSATLSIADDALPSPQAVALYGTGAPGGTGGTGGTGGKGGTGGSAGAMQLAPASVAFGTQAVNTLSSVKTVTLTNSSTTSPLTISGLTISGPNASDFAGQSSCPLSPASLAAGGVCQITLAFAPASAVAESATMTVTSTASNSPLSVTLSGTGIAGAGSGATGSGSNNFTLTPAVPGVAVTQGSTAVYSVTVAPLLGFKDSLAFTCSGPVGSNCSVSPTSLQMDGNTTSIVKLTVNTTGGNGVSANALPGGLALRSIFLAVLPFSMMGMLLITKRRGIWLVLTLVAVSVVIGMVGCGSPSSSKSPTPAALAPGAYQVTLTATSNGATPVFLTFPLNLQVNKQ